MKAVVLAAGRGARLGRHTEHIPKCMITIGPRRIIDYQLQSLEAMHVRDVVVVVGFMADTLQRHLTATYPGLRFTFVENPDYATTNTVYSLSLALDAVQDDDFIYCNADVLFHAEILRRLLYSPEKNVLAVSRTKTAEEEVKVLLEGSRIMAIGKDVPAHQAYGEFIGIAKFSQSVLPLFSSHLKQVIAEPSGRMQYFEAAVQRMVRTIKISALDITDLPSIEIDFPEDLQNAQKRIIHKIARTKESARKLKILFYAERNLHLPFLEPVHDYIADNYPAELAFSSPPHMLSQGGRTGCGLAPDEIRRLKSKTSYYENPSAFEADIAVVADACFYPVRHCKKIVNVGHGLICKGWFYTDDPVVRRENRADLVCVPGAWHREILQRNVFSPMVITGFIKTDAVARCSDYEINTFREKYRIPADTTIVLFAPTYNEELSAVPCLGERVGELADEKTVLAVKLHGMTDKRWVDLYRTLAVRHTNIVLIQDADFAAAMCASSVMISDVSSAAAEYMLLDKPVVFFNNPRREQYCRYRPDDIEYVIRDAGIQAGTVEELKLALRLSLACPDEHAPRRRAYAARLSTPPDGRCAQRAAEAIMDLADGAAEHPVHDMRISIVALCSSPEPAEAFVRKIAASNDGSLPEIIMLGRRPHNPVAGITGWIECAELNRKAFLRAIGQATGQYIVFMRTDSILPRNWARWLLHYFKWFPDAGAVRALSDRDDYERILESVPPAQRPGSMAAHADYFLCALMGNQIRAEGFNLQQDCVMLSRAALETIVGDQSFHSADESLEGLPAAFIRKGYTLWQAVEVFCYADTGNSELSRTGDAVPRRAPQPVPESNAAFESGAAVDEITARIRQAADLKKSKKDYAAAIACLEHAKRLVPAITGQGAPVEEADRCVPECRSAPMEDSQQDARHLYEQARRFKKDKNYAGAIELLEAAKASMAVRQGGMNMQQQRIGDLQFEIYQQLGECYAHTGDIEKAREHFDVARALKPDSPLPLIGLGVAVMQRHCFDEAEVCFRKALELEPDSDRALTGLGMVLQNAGRHDEGLAVYRQAMESNPTNLTALMGVVQTAYATSRYDAAEQSLQMYLEHYPANVKILYCLAGTYFKQRRYGECRAALDRIFIFQPDHREARELLTMLDEVRGYAYERCHNA